MRASDEAYFVRIFTLTGRAQPAADATFALEVETALARAEWTATQRSPSRRRAC